jgi:UDP:flavonoid glycosyltransferase YjiC (YdhE family)
MRVLVATTPGYGHVLPLVPLARALREAAHDVLWATAADAGVLVAAAGIDTQPAGLTEEELLPLRADLRRRAAPLRPDQLAGFMFPNMFGGLRAPRMVDQLLELARSWAPDLIVHEQGELASPLVAALVGVPSVAHGFGSAIPPAFLAEAGERVAPMWRAHARDLPPYAGCFQTLYLDPYPPSMQRTGADHIPVRQLIRPVPYTGEDPAELPPLVTTPDERPLVYLTLGTVSNDEALLADLLAALSPLPIRVLATVGPIADPAAIGAQPPHITVEQFVSQTAVLPHCDVVVSHAGSGTVLGALVLGLPQVCLPQAADQFRNSEAVQRNGTGVVVRPDELTPERLAGAVLSLVGPSPCRDRAVQTAAEIAGMPAPAEVVTVLADVVG